MSRETRNHLADGEGYEHIDVKHGFGLVNLDLLKYIKTAEFPNTENADGIPLDLLTEHAKAPFSR